MWLLITRKFRQWIVLSVAVPLGARLLGVAARKLERRAGRTTALSRALYRASALGGRRKARGGEETIPSGAK